MTPRFFATLLTSLLFLLQGGDARLSNARKWAARRLASGPSKLTCDAVDSCSPSGCCISQDNDCPMTAKTYDFAAGLAATSCKTCTQSTDARCTTLAAVLRKNSGIAAAYCNADFLVIWSTGLPQYDATTDYLAKIPLPPGGDAQCRVRSVTVQPNVYKIPLSTIALADGASNTLPNPLPGVPGMPAAGAIGVAVDGVPMFPNYNNRGMPTWISCEVDRCNAHGGKGFDYHYHGDPFGSKCMYSEFDYAGLTHPPLIGFALDGYSIYGRYTDSSQEGANDPLDSCGGQWDDTRGYHYHASVETLESTNSLDGVSGSGPFTYTSFKLAPTTCWKGDVSKIANFWGTNGQAMFDRSKGSLSGASDYGQIKPCCGSTSFFVADSVAINGAGTCGLADCSAGTLTTNGNANNDGSTNSNVGTSNTCSGAGAGTGAGKGPGTGTGQDGTGSCSGTDDKGKTCPPEYTADRPCPPGCTSSASASGGTGTGTSDGGLPLRRASTRSIFTAAASVVLTGFVLASRV